MRNILFCLLIFVSTNSFSQTNEDEKILSIVSALQKKYIIDANEISKDTLYIHLLDTNYVLRKYFYFKGKLVSTKKEIPCDKGLRVCLWLYKQKKNANHNFEFTSLNASTAKGYFDIVLEDKKYFIENLSYFETIK